MNIADAILAARDLFETSTSKTPVGIWEVPTPNFGTNYTCGYWADRSTTAILTISKNGLRAA